MPSMSVRSFAEMLAMPMYEQVRILEEQKFPRRGNAQFKIPYYAEALNAIRRFYRQGNNPQALQGAIAAIQIGGGPDHKKNHNIRVINSFSGNHSFQRNLVIQRNVRRLAYFQGVEVRLNFDLVAQENGNPKFIFMNFRAAPIVESTARVTLELSKWILEQNGVDVNMKSLEFLDLHSGGSYKYNRVRNSTITIAETTAGHIQTLWPTIV